MYSTGFLYAFRIRFFRNRIDKTKKYDQYLIQEYFYHHCGALIIRFGWFQPYVPSLGRKRFGLFR